MYSYILTEVKSTEKSVLHCKSGAKLELLCSSELGIWFFLLLTVIPGKWQLLFYSINVLLLLELILVFFFKQDISAQESNILGAFCDMNVSCPLLNRCTFLET